MRGGNHGAAHAATLLLLLAGIAIGALAARFIPRQERSAEIASELGTLAKPGPWGEIYTVPFVIAAPEELLPVRTIESGGTHWVFKNSTVLEISHLLEAADLPADQRDALLAPAVAQLKGIDLELAPTPAMVASLPDKARAALYRKLSQFPENRSAFFFIHKDTLADRFDDSGIAKDTLALFHKFCCEHGDYLVFGGLPAMLAQLPSYEEKVRFVKALTRQKTMLIRLRPHPRKSRRGNPALRRLHRRRYRLHEKRLDGDLPVDVFHRGGFAEAVFLSRAGRPATCPPLLPEQGRVKALEAKSPRATSGAERNGWG